MKKIIRVSWFLSFLIFFLALAYLLFPPPAEPPPLPGSIKSSLPGDTVEIPGLFAYFTNLSRQEVISFYQNHYSRSRLWAIPLPSFRLNHPPEYTWEVIRDTEHSSYLEEIVHPFRESFYINGYEPANDPFVEPGNRRPTLEYEGSQYQARIVVLPVYSNPFTRIILLFLVIGVIFYLKMEAVSFYGSLRRSR